VRVAGTIIITTGDLVVNPYGTCAALLQSLILKLKQQVKTPVASGAVSAVAYKITNPMPGAAFAIPN
jgi:hypothetical protein